MTVTVETKIVKLSSIKLNSDNPRTITKKAMDYLVKSLTDFPEMMQMREIVVDENYTVLGGNMRLLALKKIKLRGECTAKIVKGLTEAQKREFIIKDNSTFGDYDFDTLANSWSELPLIEWGVDLPEDWLKSQEDTQDAEPQIDRAAALNEIWKCETGQLWTIGQHRLLVGDSTKGEDVVLVMGGEKADMVFTDPPYGMNLDTDFSDMVGIGTGKKYEHVQGDDVDYDPAHIFRDFPKCKEVFLWGADYYAERIPKRNAGSWVVWDKMGGGNGVNDDYDKMFGSNFELCWSMTKHKRALARVLWKGIFGLAKEDTKSRIHPTQKPTDLAVWFLSRFSVEGSVIADIFLGSGTTMVACQNLNRKCRGIEISPAYCAVILQRMEDAFGIKGVRI